VIAADLGGKINQQSLQGDIVFHRDALLAVRDVDLNGQKKPTPASSAVAGQLRKELFAEELRLLYVGLTRACEKLIMVGSGDIGKLFSRYAAYGHLDWPALPGSALLAVNSMLQWILMALAGHSDLQVLWDQMELKNDQYDQDIDRPFGSRFKVSYYNWNQQKQWKVGKKSTGQKSDIVHWPDDMLACVSELKPLPVRPGPDEDELAGIVRMLEWRYPYQQLVSHKTKFAVTEFKGHHTGTAGAKGSVDPDAMEVQFATGGELFRWPDDPALQGAARGSAVHKFIQYVDLADELSLPGLTDQLGTMVDYGRLTVQETSLIDLDMVAKFFDSQLGRLLKQYHQDVQREVQFCYSMRLWQLPVAQKLESDEKILVKGVIDCLVRTGQGLVIIDYKTDQVSGRQVAQRAEVYRNQLEIYCRAMQEILGQPVLAGHLHFLMPCKSVTIWPADNMAQRDEN